MPTNTTNYSFKKPVVGADEDLWGGYINDNFDSLDSLLSGTTALTSLDITGDFTVDTNTLHVDSTNNRVGVGTASPATNLHVSDGPLVADYILRANSTYVSIDANQGGTAAAPALIVGGDTDTGWYRPSSNIIGLSTAGTERMRIDASGNVGIGISSPARGPLHLNAASGASELHMTTTNNGTASTDGLTVFAGSSVGTDGAGFWYRENGPMRFATNSTERMRIDASGNVLVGTTNALPDTGNVEGIALSSGSYGGRLGLTRDNGAALNINRKTSDGALAYFYKNGTTVGSIGTHNSDLTVGDGDAGLKYSSSSNQIYPWNMSTNAISDNLLDMGTSSGRFDDIYATNGTIQTSDQNEKQQIASLTDAEITAAKAISKLFKTFKWNDSVAEKGDAARTHSGVIAQEVEQAMTDAGLNAGDYAFFISNTWWETQTEVPAVEAVAAQDAVYEDVIIPAVLDEEGNEIEPERTEQRLVSEAVEAVEAKDAYTRTDTYDTLEEAPEGATERTRLGIRYPELLAFIGAATEQRLASIEARLDAIGA